MALTDSAVKLHVIVARHARGILSAYEQWIKDNRPPDVIELNPDPKEHFERYKKPQEIK